MEQSEELRVQPSWGRRLIGMEGLRGLAATTVLIGHTQSHLGAGVALGGGVDLLLSLTLNGLTLFFALSGFLLFRPFATAIVSGGALPAAGRFFRNRALRVYPAYVVILLVVSLVLGAAYTRAVGPEVGVEGVGRTVGFLTDPLTLLANLTMLHTLFPGTIKTGLGASWSLTVELMFYLVLPVISWLAWRAARALGRWGRVLAACAPAIALLALGLVGRVVSYVTTPAAADPQEAFYWQWGSNWHAVLARSLLSQADLFAFGMLAAVGLVIVERGLLAGRTLMATRIGALGLVVVAVYGGRHFAVTSDTWWALGCGALIFLVAAPSLRGNNAVWAKALEWLPFRYVGLVSYSMYLWHLPVIWVLRDRGFTAGQSSGGLAFNVVLVFVVTLALASLTYFGIEKPALRLKNRPRVRIASRVRGGVPTTS